MTARTRDPIASLAVILCIATSLLLLFAHLAHADTPTSTPTADTAGLLGLLLSGHILPAVGAALVLGVGLLRSGAARIWPWFGTQLGGYALAYICSYALYLGTSWQAGAPWDVHLLLTAFTAALVASGVLDHWRDILALVTSNAGAIKKTTVAAMLMLLLVGCTATQHVAASAGHSLVNCTATAIGTTPALDLATLAAVANVVATEKAKCSPTGALSWDCVKGDLESEGETLGGCAFLKLLAGAPTVATRAATATPDPGRAAFEAFRAKIAGGATYHTAIGDI